MNRKSKHQLSLYVSLAVCNAATNVVEVDFTDWRKVLAFGLSVLVAGLLAAKTFFERPL